MAGDKPPAKAAEKKEEDREPALAKAGESSDPAVQDLLARREIAIRNDDKDGVAAADADLKEHGVTAE